MIRIKLRRWVFRWVFHMLNFMQLFDIQLVKGQKVSFLPKNAKTLLMRMYIYTHVYTHILLSCGRSCIEKFLRIKGKKRNTLHKVLIINTLQDKTTFKNPPKNPPFATYSYEN